MDPFYGYFYPGEGVFRNKLDIHTSWVLEDAERSFSAQRAIEWMENPKHRSFDAVHLREIHRYLFSDLYDWAGEWRTCTMARSQTRFADPARIENCVNRFSEWFIRNRMSWGKNEDAISEGLGTALCILNNIHPFREGNGRTQRLFAWQAAKEVGYNLSFQDVRAQEMAVASIYGAAGDSARMVRIVRRGLSRMESQKEVSASERLLRKAEGMKSVGLDEDGYTF